MNECDSKFWRSDRGRAYQTATLHHSVRPRSQILVLNPRVGVGGVDGSALLRIEKATKCQAWTLAGERSDLCAAQRRGARSSTVMIFFRETFMAGPPLTCCAKPLESIGGPSGIAPLTDSYVLLNEAITDDLVKIYTAQYRDRSQLKITIKYPKKPKRFFSFL